MTGKQKSVLYSCSHAFEIICSTGKMIPQELDAKLRESIAKVYYTGKDNNARCYIANGMVPWQKIKSSAI